MFMGETYENWQDLEHKSNYETILRPLNTYK